MNASRRSRTNTSQPAEGSEGSKGKSMGIFRSPSLPSLAWVRFASLRSPSRRGRLMFERLEGRALLAGLDEPMTFAPGEILIGLDSDDPAEVREQAGGNLLRLAGRFAEFGLSRGEVLLDLTSSGLSQRLVTRWELPEDSNVQTIARLLSTLPGVAYAEPNYVWSTAAVPDDPRFGELWGLNNTGQTGGAIDADIDALEAWDISTGSSSVIVGIIDTGIDYTHPDLIGNLWVNPGEIPGDGQDNDGNGYIDDVHGINAITGTGNPMDDNFHGTHVAGTIGAVGNNGVGVVGVNHDVSIAACKFLGSGGSGSTTDAIECFQYFNNLKLAGHNVVLTNNSWGGGAFSQALSDAMRGPAGMQPILHVVAAGNGNTNNDATPVYPATYDLPNILSVAATDSADRYASFSGYGQTTVDLAAPGVSILSTMPSAQSGGTGYGVLSGTSMATPHVAGAAALLSAVYPSFTAGQLKQALMEGTDIVGGVGTNASKPTVTNGRLNINQTLSNLVETDVLPPAAVTDLAAASTGLVSATLTWTASGDDGLAGAARMYDVRYSTSPITEGNWALATPAVGEPRPQTAGSTEAFTLKGLERNTTYYFALKVRDNLDNESLLSNLGSAATLEGVTILADGFESGLDQWTTESPWGTTTAVKRSGNSSAADSPSGNYANNANTSLTSPIIDLSGFKETQFSFWHRYDFEQGFDFGRVEISTNGGVSWGPLASYTGVSSSFQKVTFDLSSFYGRSSVMIRFRFESDFSIRRDGWYVDDVEIVGLESPGIRVLPASTLVTTEGGGMTTFSVALVHGPPTADVVIPIRSSNLDEGITSLTSLTFTPENWNTAQTVVVTGVDDALADGDRNYTVIIDPAISDDLRYHGINPLNLAATNKDNESKFFVVNDGSNSSSDRTYEYAAGGSAVENTALASGNTAPRGAASTAAGDTVWVVDAGKRVYVYNHSGALQGTAWTAGSLVSNATVEGIATNGTDVWIVDARQDRVYRYTQGANRHTFGGTLNAASSFALASGNTSPKDIVTDGVHLWVVNDSSTDRVFKYTLAGALVGSWTITSGGGSPTGITLDPASVNHLWIVDSATDRVYQFNGAAGLSSGSLAPATSFALAAGNTNPQGIADPPAVAAAGSGLASQPAGAAAVDSALLAVLADYEALWNARRRR
jgi:subtilisin family serine protease